MFQHLAHFLVIQKVGGSVIEQDAALHCFAQQRFEAGAKQRTPDPIGTVQAARHALRRLGLDALPLGRLVDIIVFPAGAVIPQDQRIMLGRVILRAPA